MRLTVDQLFEAARILDAATGPSIRVGYQEVAGVPDDDRFIWARGNWDRARGQSLVLAVWVPQDEQGGDGTCLLWDDGEILVIDEDEDSA